MRPACHQLVRLHGAAVTSGVLFFLRVQTQGGSGATNGGTPAAQQDTAGDDDDIALVNRFNVRATTRS